MNLAENISELVKYIYGNYKTGKTIISHGNYVKNTYILVAYRIILCPDTTADIAGMVLITAVMSLDSVPVLPFSSGNTVVAISSHIDTIRLS